MRIGVDVDGVLYQWSPTVRVILKREWGIDLPESEYWDYIKDHVPSGVWKQLWDRFVVEMYVGGELYPGAQDAVAELARKHEVFLISAAPARVRVVRVQHLIGLFPNVSGINFVSPTSNDKTFVQCQVYLDDKVETAIESSKTGAASLLMTRDWNKHISLPPRVIRVYDWEDVHRQVRREEGH